MQPYGGVNTSLYPALDHELLPHLERAVISTEQGAYGEAQVIIDRNLSSANLVPVVVLARAELALKQFKVGLLYRIVNDALSQSVWNHDAPEYRLIRLIRAFALLSHKGDIRPALEEIDRAREWLRDVPVSEYTDIHVTFIRHYVILVMFTSASSDAIVEEASFIPKANLEPVAWQGLTDLRECLLQRGMLNEALALFKVERTRLPINERVEAVLSFINHVKTHTSLTQECSAWIHVELEIYLAQSLYERQEFEKGQFEFQKAEELLRRWCSMCNHQRIETLTPYSNIKLFQLRLFQYEDTVKYFDESVKLLEIMKDCCHTSTTVTYNHAAIAARALDESGIHEPYQAHFSRFHRERELYQITVQENVKNLLFDQLCLFTDNIGDASDIVKALEWLDAFLLQNKGFNLPSDLIRLHRWRRWAWKRLGDPKKEAYEAAQIEKLNSSGPPDAGAFVGVRETKIALPNISLSNHGPKLELEFPSDPQGGEFLRDWIDKIGDSEAIQLKAMQLLLQWIVADLKSGVIQEDEVCALLGFLDKSQDKSALTEKLERLTTEEVFARLYTQESDTGAVVEVDLWQTRFNILSSWLSRPLNSTHNSRQYLRAVLQNLRKSHVNSCKAPLSVQIAEIERYLSLIHEIPSPVHELLVMQAADLHGAIADRFWMYCVESTDFDSDEVGAALDKAEYKCQVSLKLHKEKGDTLDLHMRRRTAADICLLKIHWLLRRPGKSMLDSDLLELREAGLRFLEEAESYFNSNLQNSTLYNDLQGLEARDQVTLALNTWNFPQKAMGLLHAGDVEPDEERTTQMWNWVQRSKARSLAMTMGINGIIPSTLLREISVSDKCRGLYERMVSLQMQIESAEPQQRFWLRQELDSHMLEMRKEERLKEVCDIRDGEPLRLSDLDRISAIVESPLVLVDWFHVPGIMDDGSLLLLIARAGLAPIVTKLDITIEEVNNWVYSHLDSPFAQDRVQRGQGRMVTSNLSCLVQPLALHTKPDDVLVFCPTMKLHRLPLHSIEIQDSHDDSCGWLPLIYRNPVVYSHSHSLLRICMWNSQVAAEGRVPLNPFIMNGIYLRAGSTEYADGRQSVEKIASDFSTAPFLDDDATKLAFITSAPTSRLIHVHSHVHWDATDPLAHHIDFSPRSSATNTTTITSVPGEVTPEDVDGHQLTAREVFDLSLSKGSHVSLIACSGGVTQDNVRDEVMGLVPALLRSGASSTVSTLWKIPDWVGARFSEDFYRAFRAEEEKRKRQAGGAGNFIDIAQVFQKAVIERDADPEDNSHHHWTSFVMHGFWEFFVPGVEGGRPG
ncbi:MAG: hypothetical protein Q9217_005259 [Psora testacea]